MNDPREPNNDEIQEPNTGINKETAESGQEPNTKQEPETGSTQEPNTE